MLDRIDTSIRCYEAGRRHMEEHYAQTVLDNAMEIQIDEAEKDSFV